MEVTKMVKADDKVEFENDAGKMEKEKYSEFDLVKAQVAVLRDTVDHMVRIIRLNKLIIKEEVEAEYFNDEEVYELLTDDK